MRFHTAILAIISIGFLLFSSSAALLMAQTSQQADVDPNLPKAAEQGDTAAQMQLAGGYMNHPEIAGNMEKAVNWYRRAAEQGFPIAQFNLGQLYHTGRGVPQDHSQAALWFRKAAEQDHVGAQFSLGGNV